MVLMVFFFWKCLMMLVRICFVLVIWGDLFVVVLEVGGSDNMLISVFFLNFLKVFFSCWYESLVFVIFLIICCFIGKDGLVGW